MSTMPVTGVTPKSAPLHGAQITVTVGGLLAVDGSVARFDPERSDCHDNSGDSQCWFGHEVPPTLDWILRR
jgi:hypothetical protein